MCWGVCEYVYPSSFLWDYMLHILLTVIYKSVWLQNVLCGAEKFHSQRPLSPGVTYHISCINKPLG